MVTRKDLVIRGDQPEQQGRSEIARRTPQGLSEVSFEFDPEQLQRSFPPLSEVNQPRPVFVQNIIINGDYHYRDEAAGAWAALSDKKRGKRQRQLQLDNEQRDREDRRERAERQHSIFTLLGFFGYLVILVVLCVMASGLAMLGVIHH